MKNPKHDKILQNKENEKRKKLNYLTNKLLKQQEKFEKLKNKFLNKDFLTKI